MMSICEDVESILGTNERDIPVVRVWKKDRTHNVMTMAAALSNIVVNKKVEGRRNIRIIKENLLLGYQIHTDLAFFRLAFLEIP